MMRILAVDYGDAHTGIAISDPTGLLTGTTTTIHSRSVQVVIQEVLRLCQLHQVEEVVVGFPRNMDGSESLRGPLYREFAAQLQEATGLPTLLWDERRTTVDAHRILQDLGKKGKQRKKTVDAVAASLILEGYLTRKRTQKG